MNDQALCAAIEPPPLLRRPGRRPGWHRPRCPVSARAASAAAVGQAAPDFSAVDTSGKTHRLSDYKGKLVVLEWTNPSCPLCASTTGGNMQGLQKEFTGKGVVWLAVNSTEAGSGDCLAPARLAGWIAEKQGQPSATLMDESGQLGQLYGAKTTPHMYIISPQGKLVYAGGIDSIPSATRGRHQDRHQLRAPGPDGSAGRQAAERGEQPRLRLLGQIQGRVIILSKGPP